MNILKRKPIMFRSRILHANYPWLWTTMRFASDCADFNRKGLVIGAYDGCNPGEFKLTSAGSKFDDELGGRLRELLKGATLRRGRSQVFMNLSEEFKGVAVAGLGLEDAGYNELECLDECKENVRCAAGAGARALQDRGITNIFVDSMHAIEAAAEGAQLGVWRYEEFRHKDTQHPPVKLDLFEDPDREGWQRGILRAQSQNIARQLEETPSNMMTPTIFAQKTLDILCPCAVSVDVRDKDWIENKKMAGIMAIAKSSCEQPLVLEIGFCGADPKERPVVCIGKGITFDTGGICLKRCKGMAESRADMAGAAVLVGMFRCLAAMNLPINVQAIIPLCESMTGGMSVKPGDVVLGLNGKTIRIEDTDNEGRICMADALVFGKQYEPCLLIDLATMTQSTKKAFGRSASGCFSTSDVVWLEFKRAGAETGDRFWRLPFWKHFTYKVTDYLGVDVNNVGKGEGGSACLAAAFLLEFVKHGLDFTHIDITGSGMLASGSQFPYLREGMMTGRPVRTLVQFFYQMACPHEKGHECGPL